MRYPKWLVAWTAALAAAGCAGDEGPGGEGRSSVRDSAGVTIVESSGPAWGEGEAWRLGDAPALDVGQLDGPPETQFYQTSDAARLSDGGLVVGSLGSHELRSFGADGEHRWTAGREGDGPGEFTGLVHVVAGPGDTILTYDFQQRRISRFAPDGRFFDARSLQETGTGGFAFVESLLPDGRAVFTARTFLGEDGPPPVGEVRRDTMEVRAASPRTDSVISIGRFQGPEMVVLQSGRTDGGFSITVSSPAFGRSTEIAAGPSGIWIGDTERFEVRRYDFEGGLRMIIRRAFEPVPVDGKIIELAMDEELRDADDADEERAIRRRWEDVPVPPFLPAYEALSVDRSGNLWVQQFEIPGAPERIWSVFDSAGAWLGDVPFPDRFRPFEIGDDYVLGRFGDELDVEHIQLWELRKPAG